MSTSLFSVQNHTLPCSHIREFPRATADSQEEVLQLAIKQYVPLDNSSPQPGDVTIIGAHANGFPKELYEPLWDEVYQRLKQAKIRIRSIWIADVAHQGASSVLNEHKLGNDPSWFDHPRDLFLMINHFRSQMPRPLIGIGHSMGGAHLVALSFLHPRLLTTLVLIDPVMARDPNPTSNTFAPAKASTVRRDRWPSRAAARKAFARSPFYQRWDPRVLELWLQYGLRNLPTLLYPSATSASATPPALSADPSAVPTPDAETEQEVTLATSKHQEVFTFLRPNFASPAFPNPDTEPDPIVHSIIDLAAAPVTPFYRPEPAIIFHALPGLRPSVLYLFGEQSDLSASHLRADKLAVTGVGIGGSGGVVKGRVKEVVLKRAGHLIPMEKVGETAEHAVEWVVGELARWREGEERERGEWAKVPGEKKAVMGEEFVRVMLGDWTGKKGVSGSKAKL